MGCFAMAFSIAPLCSPNLSLRRRLVSPILDVAFVALYHIDEIGRSAGDVMSYACLFVGREKKSVRCVSLCNERTRLAPISVTMESSRSRGGGGGACLRCLALTSMSRRFLQRRYEIRGGGGNASRHRCEERRMLRLLEMT